MLEARLNRTSAAFRGGPSLPAFVIALSLGSALVLAAPAARAQAIDTPFPEGFALSPIEPTPAGDRFFLVPDAATDAALPPDDDFPLRAMVFGHYTLNPSLRRTDAADPTNQIELVQRQLYVHAGLAYTPTPWLLLHADMPFAVLQEGEGNAAPGGAVGDLRLGLRLGFVGDRTSAFSFAPGVDLWVPTGDPDNLTGDGQVRVEPRLGVSGKAGIFVYAANVGYLFRKHLFTGSLEIGSSLTASAAAGLSLFDDVLQIGPEFHGRFLTDSSQDLAFDGRTSPLGLVFGARVQVGDVNLGVGYGPGIGYGESFDADSGPTTAPGAASRLFASVSFVPRASVQAKTSLHVSSDRDGDGVPDGEDDCVDEPGDSSSFGRRGCPEETEFAAIDSDGDGIVDAEDACPERLGSPSEDPSEHGCPTRKAAPAAPAALPDSDRDGVPDGEDACPQEAGVSHATTDTLRGCPERPAPTQPLAEPAAAKKKKAEGPPVATFVGFRKLSDTSVLVFVELTQEVAVETKQKGRVLEYEMQGARVTLRNNRNPLLATHFASVVESAQLVPQGKNVKLVVRLRADADSSARVVRHAQGATLQIEITQKPAGDAEKKPSDAEKRSGE